MTVSGAWAKEIAVAYARGSELIMDPLATKRVHVLVRVAFVWAALIVARLIQLQVVQHPQVSPKWRASSSKEWRRSRLRAGRFWIAMASAWR